MKDANFDMETLKHKIMGAGILPVCFHEGKVKVLLGKERYINHWRGSLKWSGFEGGKKFMDNNIEYTAIREFIEESLGVVRLDSERASTFDNVHDVIRNESYFARILLCINHGAQDEKRYQVTYVVEVPPQPECIDVFAHTRKRLVDVQFRLNQLRRMNDQLSFSYPYIREDTIVDNNKVKAIHSVQLAANALTIVYLEEDGLKKIQQLVKSDDHGTAQLYHKWFHARVQLGKDVETFAHLRNSINAEYNCLGILLHGKVNDEYLEKQSIQWWRVEDLEEVLRNGGFLRNDFFRAYFLPVLQRAIQEVQQHKHGHEDP